MAKNFDEYINEYLDAQIDNYKGEKIESADLAYKLVDEDAPSVYTEDQEKFITTYWDQAKAVHDAFPEIDAFKNPDQFANAMVQEGVRDKIASLNLGDGEITIDDKLKQKLGLERETPVQEKRMSFAERMKQVSEKYQNQDTKQHKSPALER